MTEHEDRGTHDEKADELESELDDMQERSERLGGEIEGTGEEWERRKADESVPGATGDLDEDGEEQDGGEADAADLDFGRALAEDGGDDDEQDEG